MIRKSHKSAIGPGRTTLEQWAVLAAVMDHGGFAQAAAVLHRSQSAVSYALARLQAALELPLLEIQGRKAVLTPHGAALLRRARSLLRDAATLERLAGGLKQGWESRLNLVVDAAFPRAHLLKILAELQQLCPTTELQLSDAILSGAEEAITGQSADVVVSSRVPAGFFGEFLVDIPFLAVAHPEHALFAIDHPITAQDLLRHVQAVVRDSGALHPRDEGWLGADRRCTFSSLDASLAAVQAGLAFAWLPDHLVAASLRQGQLRALPLALGAVRSVALHLVLVRPELAGPAARAAIECFQRHVPRLAGARNPL
ncbi:MAG TPA: LysR family transcriptional regulator [Steroidobacteraceae bacterium]|nr:LysR family transcriptional regulator [Steroidobacteraceae bacterium]